MKTWRFHWRDGSVNEGPGETAEAAFAALGFGGGSVKALDYHEEVVSVTPPRAMTPDDIECLRGWLVTTTATRPHSDRPTAHAEIDFEETTGVKLHLFYPGGVGVCIQLNADGTWSFTVGQ